MIDRELLITGYLDRFSHRPGETFSAYVSAREGGTCGVKLVRVLSGDPNPKGPGLRFVDLSSIFDREFPGRRQDIHLGSYGIVDHGPPRPRDAACTWTLLCCPTLAEQTSAVFVEQGDDRHIVVGVGSAGATAELKWPHGSVQLETGQPLLRHRWYRLWLGANPASGRVVLGQSLLDWPDKTHATAIARGIELPGASRDVRRPKCKPTARTLQRQARSARYPRGLHRSVVRRVVDPAASQGGRCLGILSADQLSHSHRYRGATVSWSPCKPADARGCGCAMERPTYAMARCSGGVCGHPNSTLTTLRTAVGMWTSNGRCRATSPAAPMLFI